MEDAVRLIATIILGLGLALILWRELSNSDERRRAGRVQDVSEVLLPIIATVALLAWVWA